MTTMRKFVFALATLVTSAGLLAGCSSSKHTGPLPDADVLVKEAAASTEQLTSVHLVLTSDGNIKDLPVKRLEGDLTTQPATAAKGNARVSIMGADADVKFVVMDGDLYGAITGDTYINYGSAANIYDVSAILDPQRGLANLLSAFTDPKAEAHETIGSADTIRISGKIPADAVNKLAPQLAVTEALPGTVWIQEDGDHQLVQARLQYTPETALDMTLSQWGEPVTIDKPAGV